MKKAKFILLLSIVISTTSNAIEPKIKDSQRAEHATAQALIKNETPELSAYKALYENSKEFNEKMANTTQWSFAFVATFLAALLGSQIFFNYRIGKKEIDKINSDLYEKIQTATLETSKKLELKIEKERSETQQKIEKIESDIKDIIKINIENQDKYFEEKISSIKSETNSIKENLKKEIEIIKIEIETLTGHTWSLRGVELNAIYRFANSAILHINQERNPKFVLNDLINILKEIKEIDKRSKAIIEKLLKLIPQSAIEQKNEIENLIKKMADAGF